MFFFSQNKQEGFDYLKSSCSRFDCVYQRDKALYHAETYLTNLSCLRNNQLRPQRE